MAKLQHWLVEQRPIACYCSPSSIHLTLQKAKANGEKSNVQSFGDDTGISEKPSRRPSDRCFGGGKESTSESEDKRGHVQGDVLRQQGEEKDRKKTEAGTSCSGSRQCRAYHECRAALH